MTFNEVDDKRGQVTHVDDLDWVIGRAGRGGIAALCDGWGPTREAASGTTRTNNKSRTDIGDAVDERGLRCLLAG